MTYIKRLLDADETIRHISNNFENDFALSEGTGIAIFRYLVIHKIIQVDMFQPINVNQKIKININSLGIHRELKIV
ncbi:TnsA endonuclease C-terminal domain-containing protein [Alkaliphilus hydrothermalis]|uniref:TnsA endonuclease C-terminal domain-containing protein n=1 Tax=Alkaliphilus hydrothermalis TaxID=1482730 RepID=A0ABS2NUC9_9FIRM|nr:TnsA endonuclease C-terminal domain-containing protein [Alkaliphilus hydrothermalis]MBM7616194.1 hypothetical protein [Alkaliphilus hydrothermalis]